MLLGDIEPGALALVERFGAGTLIGTNALATAAWEAQRRGNPIPIEELKRRSSEGRERRNAAHEERVASMKRMQEASRPASGTSTSIPAEWRRKVERSEERDLFFDLISLAHASARGGAADPHLLDAARRAGDAMGVHASRDVWAALDAAGVAVRLGERGDGNVPQSGAAYRHDQRTVYLARDLSRVKALTGAAHELGHHMCGHKGVTKSGPTAEAEATAFARGFLLGVD